MLQISKHQMGILQHEQDRRYTEEFIRHIRSTEPGLVENIGDDDLRRRIRSALPVARGYGIHGDESTAQIATLAAVIGSDFLETAEIKHFLGAPGPTVDAKVAMLCDLLSDRLSP